MPCPGPGHVTGGMGTLAQPGLTSQPLVGSLAGVTPNSGSLMSQLKAVAMVSWTPAVPGRLWTGSLAHLRPGTSQLSVMIVILEAFSKKQNKTKKHRAASVQEVVLGGCSVDPAGSCWGHRWRGHALAASQPPRGCWNWEEHFSLFLALL